MGISTLRTRAEVLGHHLTERNRQGLARVRGGFLQSVQITLNEAHSPRFGTGQ